MPGEAWQSLNEFGDFCLLKNKELVRVAEVEVARRVEEGNI